MTSTAQLMIAGGMICVEVMIIEMRFMMTVMIIMMIMTMVMIAGGMICVEALL